jgi:thiol-disulfide isomerase/thioredoxin
MGLIGITVLIVGIVSLANLLLAFGIIRRLREHSELIVQGSFGGPQTTVLKLAAGSTPAGFAATTADGRQLTSAAGFTLVAFFSTTCPSCSAMAGPFTQLVAEHGLPRESVLVVVAGSQAEAPAYLDQLTVVATLVSEDLGGLVQQAFQVTGYPAICLLDEGGAVVASDYDPARLPVPALAR